MKKLLTLLAVSLSVSLGAAHAADAPAKTAQQTKMATCNKEATGKKGDERKAFMKDCLSAKPEAAKPAASAAPAASKPASAAAPAASAEKKVSQQDKMKLCNAEAKGLKGDEFKKKRDECLKK